MLFAWARAEVFRHRYDIPMLAPQWVQMKIGPLLRREKDLRYYSGLFSARGYVRGFRRWRLLGEAARIPQRDAETFMASCLQGRAGTGRAVVEFGGWDGWFDGLIEHKALISRRLFEMLKPAIKERIETAPVDYLIAAHVRRGDKPIMQVGEVVNDRWNHAKGMPDQWFVNSIRNVREALGFDAPVKVFSDARPEQLESLLEMSEVTLADSQPSIVDMYRLSRARVLISTSTSSFSAWATYLGGMPTLWYPGLIWNLVPERPGFDIETDWNGNLPAGAREAIRSFAGS